MNEGRISKNKLKVSKNRLIPRGRKDQHGNDMLGRMWEESGACGSFDG
jgi:hypothetical protein